MQILILSLKFPYPLKDGGAIATYQIVRGLTKQGHAVHLLSFNTSKHFVNQEDIPKDYFTGVDLTLVELDTHPNPIKALKNLLFSSEPYILERFRDKKFGLKLKELLKTGYFDLVQVEGLYMLAYLEIIRQNSNAKIAYRPHNLEHQIWELLARTSKNLGKRIYFKILTSRILSFEKKMLGSYDCIVPISTEDANYFQTLGCHKPIKVAPTGFNITEKQVFKEVQSEHRLFFIGSLEWMPNQQGIVWFIENCWKEIRLRRPDLKFYIAGRNAPSWLVEKINHNGIIFAGEVEDAMKFVENKTIMLVPLLSGSGMRIKIIEAFVQSKAVVATSLAARGTGAIDGKHLLIADTPSLFIDHVIQLVDDQNVYNKVIENAKNYAKDKFDNDLICSKLSGFYESGLKLKN